LSDYLVTYIELVSQTMLDLHCGQASDITRLTAEHLIYSDLSVSIVLARLFRSMLVSGVVPVRFKESYIVPVICDKIIVTMHCDF